MVPVNPAHCLPHARMHACVHAGMTAMLPDYALLCCCAASGLGRITREHLAVAVALQIPVAVVITRADLVRMGQWSAGRAQLSRC